MARYKRYFPVSHDINHDPDILELKKRFGLPGFSMWLEILAILDKHENQLKVNPAWVRKCSLLVGCRLRTGLEIINHLVQKRFIVISNDLTNEFETVYMARNYAEYHRSSLRNVDELGNETKKISVPPNLPLLSKDKRKKKTVHSHGVQDPLRSGEEEKSAGPKAGGSLDNSGEAESSAPEQEGAQPGDYEPERFQKIWNAWPKKEGYHKAQRVWNRLKLDYPTMVKIWNDLPAWRMYAGWTQYNARHCPKLENWLEKQGWLDDPPRPKVIG